MPETLMTWGDRLLGAVLISLFLGASLIANLYGVNAVMDNTISIYNQMAIATGCVLIEAFGFIKARSAWHHGAYGSWITMIVLTVLVVGYSLSNEAAFYNVNFSNKSTKLENQVLLSKDAAKEKGEIEARLAKADALRPVAAIEADISKALTEPVKGEKYGRTLARATHDCTDTRHWAYKYCGGVLSLRAELATAAVALPQAVKDRARLETIRQSQDWMTSVGETHPGAGFLARIWNETTGHTLEVHGVQDGVIVFTMLLLQILNLFFPYAWFHKRREADTHVEARASVAKPQIAVDNLAGSRAMKLAINRAISFDGIVIDPFDGAAPDFHGALCNDTPKRALSLRQRFDGVPSKKANENNDCAIKIDGALHGTGLELADVAAFDGASCASNEKAGVAIDDAPDGAALLSKIVAKRAEAMPLKDILLRFCDYGDNFEVRVSDLHAVYKVVTPHVDRVNDKQFGRLVRAALRGQVAAGPRRRNARTLTGLRLNAAGYKLVEEWAASSSASAGMSANRHAAIH